MGSNSASDVTAHLSPGLAPITKFSDMAALCCTYLVVVLKDQVRPELKGT